MSITARLVTQPRTHRSAWSFARGLNWPFWVVFAVLLAIWQIFGSRKSVQLYVVPPSRVVTKAAQLWRDGTLLPDIRTSGLELLLGFLLGSAIGVVLGLLAGNWQPVRRALTPFVAALYAIPIIALAPLFVITLGIGLESKVAVVALTSFFPTYLTTTSGVVSTDTNYRELAKAFRLPTFRTILSVALPSALPFIASGLRIAIGRGLTAVMAGELFGARQGLGLLVFDASNQFDTASLYVGMAIFAIAGVLLTRLFEVLENKLSPWRASS